MSADYVKYRQLVLVSFAIDAGKLLGFLGAHYELLASEGLPVAELVEALEKLRTQTRAEAVNLS